MAETPYMKFRLGPATVADIAALAASNGGVMTTAVKEAVAYWRVLVEEAARLNADELTREEWVSLGHLNDPDPFPADADIDDRRAVAVDWAARLAHELVGQWEGRPVLALHRDEAGRCRELAGRIGGWGLVRGYALMAALRYFWRRPEAGIAACMAPEVWLTPTAKGE